MIGLLMNDELERIWKKAVLVYFKLLSQHLSGGTEEYHESLSQYIGLRA
jgi:hypothetical protein